MGAIAALSTPGVVASCLIFVVLFSSSSSQSGPNAPKPGYMLTLPKVLWSNQTVSAHLNLFNLADEGTITIKFMRSDSNSTVWEQQEKMKGEASKPLELFVPPVTESQMMQLKIEGRFGAATEASTPAYTIDNTQNVYVEARPWITFIQSDKELYLPGQLIRFRILSVTPDLRPRLEPIADVWLEDTTGTRVAQWKSVPVIAYVGIAQMEFQLSEEPPQGTWFIKAKIDGQTEMKTIQVAEYVLPKFSLSIVKPDVVLANAASIPIEFCARYTHGQPVKGILNAEISPRTYRYDSNERKLQVKITDQQISGCHKLVVTEAEMGMDNGRLRPYGMQITASFKEEGTDVREDASTSLSFLFHEVELNFYKDTPQFFKPGLDFDGRVRVLSASTGQAVSGEKIEICVSGKQPSGGFQWIPFGCKNLTSGEDGYVKFTVPPVSSNFTELTISAKAVDRPNEEYPKEQQKWGDRMSQAESSHYVKAWYSPSESYIKSDSDVVGSLPCNTKASIHIHLATTSDPPDHLYYEVKSRGSKMTQSRFALPVSSESVPETVHAAHRIELNSTYLFEPKKNMTKFSGVLPLEITPEMSPVAIVLVYYVRPDSEVVADYLKLSVEKCLSHQVSLEWSKSEDYPGSSVKLSVKAEPESACGIRVVDRSVDLLKSSQQLNLNTVFSQLSRFTESYTGPVIKDDWEYCQKRMSERTTTTETPTTEATTTTTAASDSKASSTESPEEASKRLTTPHILPFFNYFSSHADALDAFENAGVLAMTDLTIETRPCQEGHLRPMPIWRTAFAASPVIQPTAVDGIAFEEGTNDAGEGIVAAQNKFASSEPDGQIEAAAYGGFNGVQLPKPALKLRDYFPETWLWSVDLVGTEGLVVRDETLPHTVTEWVGNAICSNKKHGFGISNVAKIKAFQPFFIQFTMPYSVKRNEKMPLKVSIFNHMDHDMPVTVTLEDSENLNVTDSGSNSFSFCLKKADSEVVPFNLTFEALGEINVTVEAAVNPSYNQICGPETILAFQDKVVKKMIVEPEGFPVEETRSKFICAQGLEGDEEGNATTWEFELPDNLVKDSERMFVRASGDILGPSLSNLESLVQLPVGCGEQNMVLFAPNIHVMKYLSKTSQLDPTIKERLLRNMRTGYQRELNYKHNDGSYSAFGSSDPEGSMWLTAFVVRSFGQSADFITVDEKQLRDSIAWILSRRLENGCFPKVGTVHHKEMKGGISTDSGSPAPLTAYVLMSLLESGIPVEEQVVEEALNCVSKDTKPSLYTQALAAFAFASSGGNYTIKAEELLSKLLAGGEKKNGLLWIPVDDTLRSAVNVEATAYALLTMAKLNKIDADLGTDKDRATALSMVRWIAQQRNSKGGFVSTQDTVVALEALAEYAAAMGLQGVAMDVFVMEDISENSKLDISKSFSVSEENKLIQQEMKLSSVPKKLTLQGYGTGCALVQASLRYSITDAPPEAAFILELNPMSFYWGPSRKLSICARYDGPGGDSNMVVVEIGMLSGYIPDKGELSKDTEELRNAGVKRWEVNPQNNQLNLYFNSLSPETKCITVDLIQSVQMENLVPAVVRVYDYYNPELFATKNYTFETWAPRPDVKVPADPVPVPAATPIPLQETTAANATTTTAAPSASPAALEETTVPTTVRGARLTSTTSKPDAHPSPKKMADANKKSPGATTTTTPVPSTVTPSSSSRNSTTA